MTGTFWRTTLIAAVLLTVEFGWFLEIDMREIVGAKINGGTITNSLPKIVDAAKAGRLGEVYDRKQMQFMSSCDLGRNWDLMASGPTLFLIGDDGKPNWPNADVTGLAPRKDTK